MKACDFANYARVPTQADIDALRDLGISRVIVGCSYGTVAHDQLQTCHDAGFEIEAYAWVSFKDDWQACLLRALTAIAGLPVYRLWLDCEEDPGQTPAPQRINDAYKYCQAERPDLAYGIYTGGYWWRPNTGDWQGMSLLPLWTAEYHDPSVGPPALYGGWTTYEMWQYAGTTDIGTGFEVDLSTYEEEHMPTPEYTELYQRDEDIKTVVAKEATATDFLIEAVNAMAEVVYKDDAAALADLKARVAALEAGGK